MKKVPVDFIVAVCTDKDSLMALITTSVLLANETVKQFERFFVRPLELSIE